MANITDVYGNIPKYKAGYKKLLGLGEGIASDEFIMTIENYPEIRWLIQATQLPALQRENIESYGPHGVQFNQAGKYKNAQDVTITIKETIKGYAYKFLRECVQNKTYLTIKLACTGESFTGGNGHTDVLLEDAWIEIDAQDLQVDDGTTLVRPSGTIHASWIGWVDEGAGSMGLNMGE